MAKIDGIYDAVDDFGLFASAEARELGVSNAELVQLARRGKLQRVVRGVYRMSVRPYQEVAPYAIAVKSIGSNAYLYGALRPASAMSSSSARLCHRKQAKSAMSSTFARA